MARLRYGIVTFKGNRAGILREEPGNATSFEYDLGFDHDIACCLPASQRTHFHPNGLHPFFSHLGPEGWLRERQSAFEDLDTNDDFGILLAFAGDCIGAVGIIDPEAKQDRRLKTSNLSAMDQAANTERTISGVQAKILCNETDDGKLHPAKQDEPAPIIAKFSSENLPDLVANEAGTMALCKALLSKDDVAQTWRTFVTGIPDAALAVRRFDRKGAAMQTKLRCEDFAQILGVPPGRDHRGKYNASYGDIGRALSFSSAPLIDARRAFIRLVVYVLLGNVDCHLKNWSLLETPNGLRLSPAYDVLNGYIYGAQGYTTRFGLLVNDQRLQWENYDRDLLLRIAPEFGLPRKAAESALKQLYRKKEPLFKNLKDRVLLSEEKSFRYANTVKEAWERIYD